MDFVPYRFSDTDSLTNEAVHAAISLYNETNQYGGKDEAQIENALTTPFHHIFQVSIMKTDDYGRYQQDYIYNIYIDKRTNDLAYTEPDSKRYTNEKHVKRVYMDWFNKHVADELTGDLKGILDL